MSLAEEEAQPIVENESRAPGEVDLSAFNDLCRKILAKKIPDGYKTGKKFLSCLRMSFFLISFQGFCAELNIRQQLSVARWKRSEKRKRKLKEN